MAYLPSTIQHDTLWLPLADDAQKRHRLSRHHQRALAIALT
jgi:hypothetical protein